MAWKKEIKSRRQVRITIPQATDKPIHLLKRDILQAEEISPDPWYWIFHRRIANRPWIGGDPLEDRAVSKYEVRGTKPERIVYAKLVEFGLVDGIDFTFQSSMQGGRIELGGIVADFVLPILKIVIQVQGRTHDLPLRKAKDEQQIDILSEMGYTVYELDDEKDIYDLHRFERIMRDMLFWGNSRGSGGVWIDPVDDPNAEWLQDVLRRVIVLEGQYEEVGRRY